MVDREHARFTLPGGRIVDLGNASSLEGYGNGAFVQHLMLPDEQTARFAGSLEMDYSLTVMRADPDQRIAAAGARQWIPGFGVCATRTPLPGAVEVGCVVPGALPCPTLFLENARTLRMDPGHSECKPNAAPYFGRMESDSLGRFYTRFGLSENDQLEDMRVVVRVHRPQAHLSRKIVVPDIRLRDWRAN